MNEDFLRKSTVATLTEIVQGEKKFQKETGIDLRNEDEWKILGDIVRSIEEKLALKMPHSKEMELSGEADDNSDRSI